MGVAKTLFSLGLLAAGVAGVVYGARVYEQRRLDAGKKRAQLPAPPGPGDTCATWGPLFDAGGNIVGHWIPGAQGQPKCVPVCNAGYLATRTGDRDFDWACVAEQGQPQPEPQDEYPPPDACVVDLYSRAPLPPEHEMYQAANQGTKVILRDMRFHLNYRAQNEIMLGLLDKIEKEPSARTVMVRRTLEDLAPLCDWWVDEQTMRPSQALVYESALSLSLGAEVEMGWEHPQAARKNMVPREYLGIMSTGTLQMVPGQHVEILVVEGPEMRFAEHVIAKTIQGGPAPRVVVVPSFRGVDVTPRFGARHGFSVGTQVTLESSPPTSVYRVYPKEWQS